MRKKTRATFKARFKKVIGEWSFYLMVGALILGSAPEVIPHLDALLSHCIGEEARKVVSEILLILGILSRFVPPSVRKTVQEKQNEK